MSLDSGNDCRAVPLNSDYAKKCLEASRSFDLRVAQDLELADPIAQLVSVLSVEDKSKMRETQDLISFCFSPDDLPVAKRAFRDRNDLLAFELLKNEISSVIRKGNISVSLNDLRKSSSIREIKRFLERFEFDLKVNDESASVDYFLETVQDKVKKERYFRIHSAKIDGIFGLSASYSTLHTIASLLGRHYKEYPEFAELYDKFLCAKVGPEAFFKDMVKYGSLFFDSGEEIIFRLASNIRGTYENMFKSFPGANEVSPCEITALQTETSVQLPTKIVSSLNSLSHITFPIKAYIMPENLGSGLVLIANPSGYDKVTGLGEFEAEVKIPLLRMELIFKGKRYSLRSIQASIEPAEIYPHMKTISGQDNISHAVFLERFFYGRTEHWYLISFCNCYLLKKFPFKAFVPRLAVYLPSN